MFSRERPPVGGIKDTGPNPEDMRVYCNLHLLFEPRGSVFEAVVPVSVPCGHSRDVHPSRLLRLATIFLKCPVVDCELHS